MFWLPKVFHVSQFPKAKFAIFLIVIRLRRRPVLLVCDHHLPPSQYAKNVQFLVKLKESGELSQNSNLIITCFFSM